MRKNIVGLAMILSVASSGVAQANGLPDMIFMMIVGGLGSTAVGLCATGAGCAALGSSAVSAAGILTLLAVDKYTYDGELDLEPVSQSTSGDNKVNVRKNELAEQIELSKFDAQEFLMTGQETEILAETFDSIYAKADERGMTSVRELGKAELAAAILVF